MQSTTEANHPKRQPQRPEDYHMKCLLVYFTGTFNTRFVTHKLRDRFLQMGWTVDTHEIDPLQNIPLDYTPYDLVGLGSPIHGFCAPYAFLRFIRAQHFPAGKKVFIYKNSGETYHANDASSKYVLRKLRKDHARVENEYHFMMPYNIHFRFEDKLIKEMFLMNKKLQEILVYEITHDIPNLKPYKLWPRTCATVVSRPQYIGGNVNSFFYKVDPKKCIHCDLCIKRCPTKNIYRDHKGEIAFHHHCLMCMRCSFFCPTDAFDIGFLEDWGWHVNGAYDYGKIAQIQLDAPVITPETKGFFKCYIETYRKINERYDEIFGEGASRNAGEW